MTESFDAATLREVVTFQLRLLELYESLLENCEWDESKVNATLKTFMSSVLALMRVQQSIGTQVVTVQKELIRTHRARLEQWLAEHPEAPGDGGGWNGFPGVRPDDRVAPGRAE